VARRDETEKKKPEEPRTDVVAPDAEPPAADAAAGSADVPPAPEEGASVSRPVQGWEKMVQSSLGEHTSDWERMVTTLATKFERIERRAEAAEAAFAKAATSSSVLPERAALQEAAEGVEEVTATEVPQDVYGATTPKQSGSLLNGCCGQGFCMDPKRTPPAGRQAM